MLSVSIFKGFLYLAVYSLSVCVLLHSINNPSFSSSSLLLDINLPKTGGVINKFNLLTNSEIVKVNSFLLIAYFKN